MFKALHMEPHPYNYWWLNAEIVSYRYLVSVLRRNTALIRVGLYRVPVPYIYVRMRKLYVLR